MIGGNVTMCKNDIEGQLKELDKIDKKIRECKDCLGLGREQVPTTLPTVQFKSINDILFVGRDPAKNGWRESGKAFFKLNGNMLPSGKIFKKQLNAAGIDIEQINFVELIKCYRNGKPKKEEIKNCSRWLVQQIDIIRPKVIFPLGKEPTEFFKGKTIRMEDVVGKRFYWHEIPVIPLWHPSPRPNASGNPEHDSQNKKFMKKFGVI